MKVVEVKEVMQDIDIDLDMDMEDRIIKIFIF
jgi:hypothetical protein